MESNIQPIEGGTIQQLETNFGQQEVIGKQEENKQTTQEPIKPEKVDKATNTVLNRNFVANMEKMIKITTNFLDTAKSMIQKESQPIENESDKNKPDKNRGRQQPRGRKNYKREAPAERSARSRSPRNREAPKIYASANQSDGYRRYRYNPSYQPHHHRGYDAYYEYNYPAANRGRRGPPAHLRRQHGTHARSYPRTQGQN